MCNYKYKSNYSINSGHTKCQISELYSQWNVNNTENKLHLPLDKNGICLFHSQEIEWKKENNFSERFSELLAIYKKLKLSTFNFTDFVFVAYDEKVFEIKNYDNKKVSFDFTGAVFYPKIRLFDLNLNDLVLNNTLFYKSLAINKCTLFSSLFFERAKLNGELYIFDTKIEFNSFLSHSKFLQLATFKKVIFIGEVYFSETHFSYIQISEYEEPYVVFKNVKFLRTLHFDNTIFDCGVEFSNIYFDDNSEFLNTKFSREYYTIFTSLNIRKNLSFIGSEKNKLFPYKTGFDINENSIGQILFENVNFKNIKEEHREILKRLSFGDKVEIGSGCIKYRHQTQESKILISEGNQVLITEMCQTFVNFFTVHNGLNLGLEITKRTEKYITLFYFSDENISEKEFSERLKNTEQSLLELLFIDSQTALTEQNNISQNTVKKENYIINAIDGISALMNTFFRVGVRISTGMWKSKDTQSLLSAIGFGGNIFLEPQNLHNTIENNYKGKQLIQIAYNQNITIVNQHGNRSVYVEKNDGEINIEK